MATAEFWLKQCQLRPLNVYFLNLQLSKSIFDAGLSFSLLQVEYEEGEWSEGDPRYVPKIWVDICEASNMSNIHFKCSNSLPLIWFENWSFKRYRYLLVFVSVPTYF